ncbi:MAG TPA: SdiA-regulated domain-containing protein [Bacteroidota bacterium]|nr:SdiA-regulated domain-containing protein [Bacteroidota bacterium]
MRHAGLADSSEPVNTSRVNGVKQLALLLLLPLLIAGHQGKTGKLSDAQLQPALNRYDLSAPPKTRFRLPSRLGEASGLAMTADGRLFAHDDERAAIYQLDFVNGRIIKQFSLGRFGVRADLEGLAIKDRMFYLVESNGTIYEFPEGNDGDRVEFRTYRTGLSARYDIEGLCYDPETDCLLLACKGYPGDGLHGVKAVYAFSLASKRLDPKPRFLIALDRVTSKSHKHEFNPSGIERHPISGRFFVIAAQGYTIIELSREGRILAQQIINRKYNPQPEGITFTTNGTLILCNDGQGSSGSLTVYTAR